MPDSLDPTVEFILTANEKELQRALAAQAAKTKSLNKDLQKAEKDLQAEKKKASAEQKRLNQELIKTNKLMREQNILARKSKATKGAGAFLFGSGIGGSAGRMRDRLRQLGMPATPALAAVAAAGFMRSQFKTAEQEGMLGPAIKEFQERLETGSRIYRTHFIGMLEWGAPALNKFLGLLGATEGLDPQDKSDRKRLMDEQIKGASTITSFYEKNLSEMEKLARARAEIMGMSSQMLRNRGITGVQRDRALNEIDKQIRDIQNKPAEEEMRQFRAEIDRARSSANALRDSLRSPFQKLKDDLNKVNRLYGKLLGHTGQLTKQEARQLRQRLVDEFTSPLRKDLQSIDQSFQNITERRNDLAARRRGLLEERQQLLNPDFVSSISSLGSAFNRIQAAAGSRMRDPTAIALKKNADSLKKIETQDKDFQRKQLDLQREHSEKLDRIAEINNLVGP